MRCLSENCRRDLSEVEAPPEAMTSQGDNSEVAEKFLLGVLQVCFQHHCGGLQLVAAGDCLLSCTPNRNDLQLLLHSTTEQQPVNSNQELPSQPDRLQHLSIKHSNDVMTRRRRVNDDVSQCIQSYCGRESSPNRFMCIVDHCHRARSIY